jgi:predicted phage-related endonuclease
MITYHKELEQGSPEWLQARCGLLTASEMKLLVTPTLKVAANDKVRMHLYELCAQRTTRYVEPSYVSEDMMRGNFEEVEARIIYNDKISPITDMGFITNDKWGFTIGYSPDGLVGDDGLIEIKSRKQKFQLQTIANDEIDSDYMIQLQTGLLVSERKWIDFIQYSNGMPLFVKRVLHDEVIQKAIVEAGKKFEEEAKVLIEKYSANAVNFLPTERKIYEQEIAI